MPSGMHEGTRAFFLSSVIHSAETEIHCLSALRQLESRCHLVFIMHQPFGVYHAFIMHQLNFFQRRLEPYSNAETKFVRKNYHDMNNTGVEPHLLTPYPSTNCASRATLPAFESVVTTHQQRNTLICPLQLLPNYAVHPCFKQTVAESDTTCNSQKSVNVPPSAAPRELSHPHLSP